MLGHGLALMEHVARALEILGSPAGTDVLMTFDLDGRPRPLSTPDDFGAVS